MLAKINWSPSSSDIRKFGITLIIGFGVIGGLFYWKDWVSAAWILWCVALFIGMLALVAPPMAKPFYWVWMGLAFVMGTVISTLILIVIFYGIFTPIAIIMKLMKRDALRLKKSSYPTDSYWQNHKKIESKEYYERLF